MQTTNLIYTRVSKSCGRRCFVARCLCYLSNLDGRGGNFVSVKSFLYIFTNRDNLCMMREQLAGGEQSIWKEL